MVESVKELRKICYGKGVYRPWFNKYVSKISIYVTWMLLRTPVTANQVTIFEYFLLFLGAIFLFFGNLEYIFIGLLIIHFTNLLDVVDGDIARYRKKSSLTGVHLEAIYDQLLAYFVFFPLAFGIFLQTGSKAILVVGFLCATFAKSIVMPAMYDAIVNSRLKGRSYLKQKTNKEVKSSPVNLQGSGTGKRINDIYDRFKDFWEMPNNILILAIISFIELINQYSPFMTNYTLFYWYLVIYATAAVFKQIVSFIVQYKGNAVDQYYKVLFNDK